MPVSWTVGLLSPKKSGQHANVTDSVGIVVGPSVTRVVGLFGFQKVVKMPSRLTLSVSWDVILLSRDGALSIYFITCVNLDKTQYPATLFNL